MDLFWLVVVLFSWRVLTREFWRRNVVPPDAHGWAALGRFMPERALLALYRATFFFGLGRMVAWFTWAHVLTRPVIDGVERRGYPFDFSWTAPWWIQARSLPHVSPWIVLPVTLALLAAVYLVIAKLWEPVGRAEERFRSRKRAAGLPS
jgi:hypothetical protein